MNHLFRKPVSFNQYYILLVKTGRIWVIDCGSWDKDEINSKAYELRQENLRWKVITSPSDNEVIINRIVKEMNRYN